MELVKGLIAAITSDPATGGIFAVLILGIIGMAYISLRLLNHAKAVQSAHDKMVTEYTDNLLEVINKSHERDQITTQALTDIRLVLAQMQGRMDI